VPWDHSALTSDFFFNPETQAASGEALSEGGRDLVQARLRAIEEQIRSKSDRKQTLGLVKLEQLKERVRQIEVTLREDQQRIFDVWNRRGPSHDPNSGRDASLEVGSIQLQMVRRDAEKKKLQEEIAKLNAELGMTEAEAK
jgi:hypothetical protein